MSRYDPYSYNENYPSQYHSQPYPSIQSQQYYPAYNNVSLNQLSIHKNVSPLDTASNPYASSPNTLASPVVNSFASSLPATPDLEQQQNQHQHYNNGKPLKKPRKSAISDQQQLLSAASSPTNSASSSIGGTPVSSTFPVSSTTPTSSSSSSSCSASSAAASKSKSGKPRARYISVRDPECVHALRCLVEAVRIFPRRNSNQFSKECLEMAAQGWKDWQARNNRPVDATVAQIRAHYHNKMNEWAAWNKRAANPENRVVEDRVYFKDCHGKMRSARRLPAELEHLISELHKSLPRPGYTKKKADSGMAGLRAGSVGGMGTAYDEQQQGGHLEIQSKLDKRVIKQEHGIKQERFEDGSSGDASNGNVSNGNSTTNTTTTNNNLYSAGAQQLLPPVSSVPLAHIPSNPLAALSEPYPHAQYQVQHQVQPPVHMQPSRPLESWSYSQYSQYQSAHPSLSQQPSSGLSYPGDPRNSYSLQSLLHPQSNEPKRQ